MRALAILFAGLAIGACASLTVVDKTPDKSDVAAILAQALACTDKPGEEPKCDAEKQPASVKIATLDCVALPLRSAVREAAHARCEWTGAVTRVDGVVEALLKTSGEFSLVDLTPGVYRPTRDWTLDKLD